jgi:hypothetical protein
MMRKLMFYFKLKLYTYTKNVHTSLHKIGLLV